VSAHLLALAVLVLLLHAAGAVAAVHAMVHTRTPQGAAAWAVALISLPYLTLIPYLFLGRRHFHGYVRAHRRHRSRVGVGGRRAGERPEDPPAHPDCARYRAIAAMMDTAFAGGHGARLFDDGSAAFEAMLADIASARACVLVQFFILRDDHIGGRLQQALLERAAAGVRVHVLYDGIGSRQLGEPYLRALRAGGVAIHAFATRQWSNRFQVNFRNHRKIVVVDGRCGYVGGLNVGDDYLGGNPRLSPWRDTHLRLTGPALASLQQAFAEDWHWVTGARPALPAVAPGDGHASALIVTGNPADRRETGSLIYTQLINAAQRRVWIASPYLVPDPAVATALRLAVLRGVDVRILLPARPDHRIVFAVSTLYAHELLRDGVRVYRYLPGFMHQKVVLVDEDTAMVGSMNLDNRSLRLNFEAGALLVDRAFAAEVSAMLRRDLASARQVRPADYLRLPAWRRTGMHVARLFDPIL
jgi:cardiolipin synthase A/B